MSAETELGTYKRMATITISVVVKDAPAPTPTGMKIGTDLGAPVPKDLYADVAYSWVTV